VITGAPAKVMAVRTFIGFLSLTAKQARLLLEMRYAAGRRFVRRGGGVLLAGGKSALLQGSRKHSKEKRSMKRYAGLDVSIKETSVCIVNETGTPTTTPQRAMLR
jgi:hypothetical protein